MPEALGVSLARITPPPVPSNFLNRPHLLAKFDNRDVRTLFISAPSGYGKTTLAAQWATHNPQEAIWYTPGKKDSILDIYFHVAEAGRRIIPGFAPWIEEMKKNGSELNDLVLALSNEFARSNQPITIIFDNLDELPKGSGQMSVMWAEYQPLNVRSVGLRRSILAPELTNLLAPSAENYISAADLRLTSEEEIEIMESFGLSSSDAQSREILARANGWPSAFALLCKRLSGSQEEQIAARHFLANLDGTNLINKALSQLSDDDRNFLQQLSLLDEITPEIASALTGEPQAKLRLARMSYEGLYFKCINVENEIYQMNGLIKEKFESEIWLDLELKENLQLKLAEIYQKNGDDVAAIGMYLALERVDLAAPLLGKVFSKLIYSGDYKQLTRWAKEFTGQVQPNEIGYEIVLALISLVKPHTSDAISGLMSLARDAANSGFLEKVEIYRDILKAKIAFNQGRLLDVVLLREEYNEAKQQAMGADQNLYGVINRLAAASAFLMEDFCSFKEFASASGSFNFDSASRSLCQHPHFISSLQLFAEGEMRQAREHALSELELSTELGARGIYFPFESLYVLVDAHRELGAFDQALAYAEQGLAEARHCEMWPWVAGFQAKIALCQFRRGNTPLAFDILRHTRDELVSNQVDVRAFRILDEHELLIRNSAQDFTRAKELLGRLPNTPAIAFITRGEAFSKKSLKNYKQLLELSEENAGEKLYKFILLAENAMSNIVAHQHAMDALRIGFAHGYQEIFLSRGEAFNQIILDLAATNSMVYLENLASIVRERSLKSVSDENRLTSRELDILRNLATGKPLIQISKALHISQNTMKTHLRNVYRKLGADSRDSATKIARDQLLI
jgi:ATP/maltotriose-dependent transcriptional regulator MalT